MVFNTQHSYNWAFCAFIVFITNIIVAEFPTFFGYIRTKATICRLAHSNVEYFSRRVVFPIEQPHADELLAVYIWFRYLNVIVYVIHILYRNLYCTHYNSLIGWVFQAFLLEIVNDRHKIVRNSFDLAPILYA